MLHGQGFALHPLRFRILALVVKRPRQISLSKGDIKMRFRVEFLLFFQFLPESKLCLGARVLQSDGCALSL